MFAYSLNATKPAEINNFAHLSRGVAPSFLLLTVVSPMICIDPKQRACLVQFVDPARLMPKEKKLGLCCPF
jgi:hypothetical protein